MDGSQRGCNKSNPKRLTALKTVMRRDHQRHHRQQSAAAGHRRGAARYREIIDTPNGASPERQAGRRNGACSDSGETLSDRQRFTRSPFGRHAHLRHLRRRANPDESFGNRVYDHQPVHARRVQQLSERHRVQRQNVLGYDGTPPTANNESDCGLASQTTSVNTRGHRKPKRRLQGMAAQADCLRGCLQCWNVVQRRRNGTRRIRRRLHHWRTAAASCQPTAPTREYGRRRHQPTRPATRAGRPPQEFDRTRRRRSVTRSTTSEASYQTWS